MENQKITGNEPYFPMDFRHEGYRMNEGVSVRTHLAAMFTQGIAAYSGTYGNEFNCQSVARRGIELADAFLKEINEPTP